MHHSYWTQAPEPASQNDWVHVLQLLEAMCLEPVLHKRGHCNEKAELDNMQPPPTMTWESLHAAMQTHHNQEVVINK